MPKIVQFGLDDAAHTRSHNIVGLLSCYCIFNTTELVLEASTQKVFKTNIL
jgi:hypothetical protein